MPEKYRPVIGLEIHAELKTKTKMFCDSLNDPDEKHPNINVCPVCMGHPGTLPVANEEAIKKVIKAGLALNCKIAEDTFFERKNYFYPDLPKGYQITQYQKPMCYEGYLDIDDPTSPEATKGSKRIRITRIHLEEDAGRLNHAPVPPSQSSGEARKDYSLVDYNRAGVPLMELVTEPDFETGLEVRKFAEELQLIWQYLGVSEANMEKGEMRVEVNISLMKDDGGLNQSGGLIGRTQRVLGTKAEIKNLNSIKFAADAVDYEIKRQKEILEDGGEVKQETRGWDENKKATFSQRSKEEAHDYRYFPEPDLPPIRIANGPAPSELKRGERASPVAGGPPRAFSIEKLRLELPELPQQRRDRFKKLYGLNDAQVEVFVVARHLGNYYEEVATELDSAANDYNKSHELKGAASSEGHALERLHELAANYIITEFPPLLNMEAGEIDDIEGIKISAEAFAELMVLVFHKEVSSTGAKAVLKEMAETGKHPDGIIKEKDLGQVSDIGALEVAVVKVIAGNAKAVEDYKKGNEAPLKFLIGMVMRETKGKANPQVVEGMLKNMLK